MSEWERDQISERTRAALTAAKARGVVLGATGPTNLQRNTRHRQKAADAFAVRLKGLVAGFRARGLSQRAMVAELNLAGVSAPAGGSWRLGQLQRMLARVPAGLSFCADDQVPATSPLKRVNVP